MFFFPANKHKLFESFWLFTLDSVANWSLKWCMEVIILFWVGLSSAFWTVQRFWFPWACCSVVRESYWPMIGDLLFLPSVMLLVNFSRLLLISTEREWMDLEVVLFHKKHFVVFETVTVISWNPSHDRKTVLENAKNSKKCALYRAGKN